MTTEQLTELKEALANASPAPWEWHTDGSYGSSLQNEKSEILGGYTNDIVGSDEDKEIITLLRNHADNLIRAVEERDQWRECAKLMNEAILTVAKYPVLKGYADGPCLEREDHSEMLKALAAFGKLNS